MKVTIDPDSGFCFGVDRAIKTAEAELEAGNTVYSLGEIVHNQVQMDSLKRKGLVVISHADLPEMKGKTVLLRAHGEPPETYLLAKELEINLIDATCPIVTKLQQRIKQSHLQGKSVDSQIVIYGKPGHAEIAGLNGNVSNAAIIISNPDEITKIDFTKPVRLFSQTTMDAEGYQEIGNLIEQKMADAGNLNFVNNKSVCKQVSGRAPALRLFAAEHDLVIFVGGNNSANGAYLFGKCKTVNEKSYYISNIEDIDNQWFANISSVGVTGATSTPAWLIEKVAKYLDTIS